MKKPQDEYTVANYTVGFVASVALTLFAYWLVVNHKFTGNTMLLVIAGLALAQFLVQIIHFLHIGKEAKPRWKLIVFSFMSLVVLIIVFGSLWIMTNLNYHHVDPVKSSDAYIIHDEEIKR